MEKGEAKEGRVGDYDRQGGSSKELKKILHHDVKGKIRKESGEKASKKKSKNQWER